MVSWPKPRNASKYYGFHEQNDHTTTECRELKKALHEHIDKGQINRFFKHGVANTPIRRILIDIESSPDIITLECIQRLKYPTRDITPLVHPIPGFGVQTVNSVGTVHLPLQFGDKIKSKNLEVDFLVIDVPSAYNVILGRSALHRVKAVIGPYLLQIQYESDDGTVGSCSKTSAPLVNVIW
ncbi:hypothetical protein Cgig2_015665 [Carnegiea gigantea]|uniref:Uncharacterized protein n=1 Tax=Carnegiea gigantea TaxID=171969 RepID=A0A9Q1QCC1_9CARY|nr:hypothetical protein Cgig2_015665 [Carnegiea gigantea]